MSFCHSLCHYRMEANKYIFSTQWDTRTYVTIQRKHTSLSYICRALGQNNSTKKKIGRNSDRTQHGASSKIEFKFFFEFSVFIVFSPLLYCCFHIAVSCFIYVVHTSSHYYHLHTYTTSLRELQTQWHFVRCAIYLVSFFHVSCVLCAPFWLLWFFLDRHNHNESSHSMITIMIIAIEKWL